MSRVRVKMEKVKRAGKALNNAGMSLVEVIISMAILSVVVVAVLQSLTTAMVYNAKARKRQDTTFKAETVMEVFKGYNVSDLYDTFTTASTGADDAKTAAQAKLKGMFGEAGEYKVTGADPRTNPGGTITFDINDIEIKSTDSGVGEQYDIQVVAKPTAGEVYAIEKFNDVTDAVFVSRETYDTEARQKAFEAFQSSDANYNAFLSDLQSNNTEDGNILVCDADGNDLDIDKVKAALTVNHIALKERVTTFTVDDSGVTVEMVYKYGIEGFPYYRKVYPDVIPDTYDPDSTPGDGEGTPPASTPPLAVAGELKYASYSADNLKYEVTVDDSSISKAELEKLYIYYYPQYATWNDIDADGNVTESKKVQDIIEIDNQRTGVPGAPAPTIRCYLIKQKCETMSEATVRVRDEGYKANVKKIGSGSVELYHNLNDNVGVNPGSTGTTASPDISGFANNGGLGEKYLDYAGSKENSALAYTVTLTVRNNTTGAEVSSITSSANER